MLLGQSVMHVQRSVKSVRRRAKHTLKGFKDMSAVLKHRSRGYGRFSRQPHTSFASLAAATLSLVLIILDTDFMGLWLHLCSLSYLPFSRQTPSSFFLTPSQFLPFWSCDNETTSAATALRMINLHKCTHRIFLIALPSRTDVCTHPANQEHALQD